MPVTRSLQRTVRFPASHSLEGDPVCSRNHGHQYTVTLTWTGEPVAGGGYPVTYGTMDHAVLIVSELAFMNLNDMLPASPPSVLGVAAYLLERMRMLNVVRVEVHESDTDLTGVADYLDR